MVSSPFSKIKNSEFAVYKKTVEEENKARRLSNGKLFIWYVHLQSLLSYFQRDFQDYSSSASSVFHRNQRQDATLISLDNFTEGR